MQPIKLLHYRNGAYQGQIKLSKRNGKGILITDQGQIIVGIWKNDKLYGNALTFLNPNEFSIGEFNRGQRQGWSKFASSDKVLVSEFNSSRPINKQLLIDKNELTYKITTPSQNSFYQSLKDQQLPQTFNQSELQQLCFTQLNSKLPHSFSFTLSEYLIEFYKNDDVFETQVLMNGYLMFRVKDEASVVGLGFVINKNNQLVSYGSYIGNKLNGYGCKFENAVRYQGIFQNGFLNGQGLKLVAGKYSFGTFQNGTLSNPIYLQQRSLASEQKLNQLKKVTHMINLHFTNIYLPPNIFKFKGTRQIIFQISLKQQYMFSKSLPTTSPSKKPTNLASKLLANREQNDTKSSVSIMTNRKANRNNIEEGESRVSQVSRSASGVNSRFKN